jgi:hypothetical protein
LRDGVRPVARDDRTEHSALPAAVVALFAFSGAAQSCDRACLLQQAKQFNENMPAHTTERIQEGDSGRAIQINEIFKILNGRVRMVDNIGLMSPEIKVSGFTK